MRLRRFRQRLQPWRIGTKSSCPMMGRAIAWRRSRVRAVRASCASSGGGLRLARIFSRLAAALVILAIEVAMGGGVQHSWQLSQSQRELLDFHLFAEGHGMVLSPRVTRKIVAIADSPLWPVARAIGESRAGMIADGRNFAGLRVVSYGGTSTAVLGCAMCHAGRAAGQFVPGLGNKTIDAYGIAKLLFKEWERDRSELARGVLRGGDLRATEGSLRYAALVSRPDLANRTQGMVPASWVLHWLYEAADKELPSELRIPGAVKVPHLWGYARKREAGLFCDGMGDGAKAGWLAAVPLTAGLPPGAVRKEYSKLIAFERALCGLQPPLYSFQIAEEKAGRGKIVFQQNCSTCHGSYRREPNGVAEYGEPRWVAIGAVQTDRERLHLVSGEFHDVVEQNPLRDLIGSRPRAGKGYFAPRLEGIWARFPYLHNGSVPSLAALLTPPDERPKLFSLKRAGELERFDCAAVGLKVPSRRSLAAFALRRAARAGDRRVYDTSRPGQSNAGHPFGTGLSENKKIALIEYLKTL